MGRSPCCSKEGFNRGAWTEQEDKILIDWMKIHGEGRWAHLPKKAGLKRCGKSCRLRWLNYLRPGIKRGNISHDEDDLIIRLHKLLGNRWSLIAGRLPGRTDNEIKNHWNTNLSKKLKGDHQTSPASTQKPSNCPEEEKLKQHEQQQQQQKKKTDVPLPMMDSHVIITEASRCNRVCLTPQPNNNKVAENDNEAKGKAMESYSCDEIGQPISLSTDQPVLCPELNDRTGIHDIELDLPSFTSDLFAFINGESGEGSDSNNHEPLQSWDQPAIFPDEDWAGSHGIGPDFPFFNPDLFVSDNGEAGQCNDSNNNGSLPFWDQPAVLWSEENMLEDCWIESHGIEPDLSFPYWIK